MLTDASFIKNNLKQRDKNAHKGNFGKVLVFAGSPGMAGAAMLCGRSALKSGSGLVQYLLPSADSILLPILQCTVPEATCMFYGPDFDFSKYDAIATGPGLGTTDGQKKILSELIATNVPLVLDADALNMISSDKLLADAVRNRTAATIMTPHIGEARRLLGEASKKRQIITDDERLSAATELSEKYGSTIVLKGAGTVVGNCKDGFFTNTSGNPGMATGGSGDVLTGVITSLVGQGYDAITAARIGVFIHGKAGDLAAAEIGEVGMISSDICAYVPAAFK